MKSAELYSNHLVRPVVRPSVCPSVRHDFVPGQ